MAVCCLGFGGPRIALAADGDLDPSFQDEGTWVLADPAKGNLLAASAAVDAGGRLVAAFSHQFDGDDHDFELHTVPESASTLPCGAAAFNLGGSLDDRVFAMAVGPGNKAVLVGRAATGGTPATAAAVARIDLSTCALDGSFSGDGLQTVTLGIDTELRAVALQPDGKIVAAGVASSAANADLLVLRLHPDGALDGSFGAGGIVEGAGLNPATGFEPVGGVAVQADGRIVVAGAREGADQDTDFSLIRLLDGGDLDDSFNDDGLVTVPIDFGGTLDDEPSAVSLWPDGKIVVAGTVADDVGSRVAVAMLMPDGSPAPDLGPAGHVVFRYLATNEINTVRALALQGDRKILVAGATGPAALLSNTDFAAARIAIAPAPGLDPTFGQGGSAIIPFDLGGWDADEAAGMTLQAGRVSLVGNAQRDAGVVALAAARLDNAYVFADGFESGTTAAWSSTVP